MYVIVCKCFIKIKLILMKILVLIKLMVHTNVRFVITIVFLDKILLFNQLSSKAVIVCCKRLWVLMKLQLFQWKEACTEFIFGVLVKMKLLMLLAIWKENQLIMNRHDQTLQNWAEAWSCLSNRIDKQQTKF